MSNIKAAYTGKHNKNKGNLLSKLKTEHGSALSSKDVRCIIAECQYTGNFALDEHAKNGIAAAVSERFKCLLFVSVKDQADYDAWYETNKVFLVKYSQSIVVQSNFQCYKSEEFRAVRDAIIAFYLKHPDLKKVFDARVLDEAKTYVARQLIKKEKEEMGQRSHRTTHPDVNARRDVLWASAPEELKTRSLVHVFNEAIVVVTWGISPKNLITVAISGHFTSAMRVVIKHVSDFAAEMGIGFKKNLFYIEMLKKRSDLSKVFKSSELGSEDRRISPEVKELAAMYMKDMSKDQALDFLFAFNARIIGVPVAKKNNSLLPQFHQ